MAQATHASNSHAQPIALATVSQHTPQEIIVRMAGGATERDFMPEASIRTRKKMSGRCMSYQHAIGKVLTKGKEMLVRFVDLLVTAFAVAAGLAWKDLVVAWFKTGGPLGFADTGPFFFAMAITVVGALLTTWRATLPSLSKTNGKSGDDDDDKEQ